MPQPGAEPFGHSTADERAGDQVPEPEVRPPPAPGLRGQHQAGDEQAERYEEAVRDPGRTPDLHFLIIS
jgi:hypothetical protein